MKRLPTRAVVLVAGLVAIMVGLAAAQDAPPDDPPSDDAPPPTNTHVDSAVEHRVAIPPSLRKFERTMSGDMREIESEAATWLDQNYMTGNWDGLRNRLNDWGVIPTATYVADIQGNPTGGKIHKVRYVHDIGVDLVLDMQRMIGWEGAHFHVSMSSRTGNDLSADIGNAFTVAQSCCQLTTRLVTLAYEQSLLEHRLNIRLGRISTGDDFLTSRLYWLFVNNGFDGNPLAVQLNVPYFTYPNAAWGARVRARPLQELYVAAGVYDGNPDVTRNSAHGVDFSFGGDGVLLAFEAGYEPEHHLDDGGLPGHYKIGGYYHTGRFCRFLFGFPSDCPQPSEAEYGNGGFYLLLDQMVYRETGSQGLWPFVALLFAPNKEISTYPFFLSGGLTYEGLIPGRDQDIAVAGLVYGAYSSALRGTQVGSAKQDFEMVVEWGYIITLAPWLHIQPDMQYVIKPGGTGTIPDSLVIGAQIAANI